VIWIANHANLREMMMEVIRSIRVIVTSLPRIRRAQLVCGSVRDPKLLLFDCGSAALAEIRVD